MISLAIAKAYRYFWCIAMSFWIWFVLIVLYRKRRSLSDYRMWPYGTHLEFVAYFKRISAEYPFKLPIYGI